MYEGCTRGNSTFCVLFIECIDVVLVFMFTLSSCKYLYIDRI